MIGTIIGVSNASVSFSETGVAGDWIFASNASVMGVWLNGSDEPRTKVSMASLRLTGRDGVGVPSNELNDVGRAIAAFAGEMGIVISIGYRVVRGL